MRPHVPVPGPRARAALAAALLLAAGCAYRIGTTMPSNWKTVCVKTFLNETHQPLIEDAATSAAVQEFQVDGTLRVAAESEADVVLKTKLTSYSLTPVSYQRNQTAAPNEYRIVILADASVTDREGKTALPTITRIKGQTTFVVTGDLTTSERRARAAAFSDLAHHIVREVVESW